MTFMQKMRIRLQQFMVGRHGPDELSLALLIAGVVLSMLSSIFRLGVLYILSLAMYIFSMYRMLSKNNVKRIAENAKFVGAWRGCSSAVKQFVVRVKNMRQYKYFKCPECHSRLRLPRKVGEVTVTCGKCRHAFKQKA